MEKRNNCVYKHTSPSGKIYIGITCLPPLARWNNGKGYYTQRAIANAIKKYGWENFTHEILADNLTREEASQKEKEYIAYYKSNNPKYGYNCTSGGDAQYFVSEETRKKQSSAKRHFIESHPDYRELVGMASKKMWEDSAYREKMSKLVSEANKAHYASHPERAAKFSALLKSLWADPTFRCKMKKAMINNKPCDDAIRRSAETRRTPILCVETGIVYSSTDKACESAGVSKMCIVDCCRGRQETSGGYHWRYANESAEEWQQRRNLYFKQTGITKRLRVCCVESGQVFKDAHEAARFVDGDPSSITKCCRGKRKTAYNYHWKYAG